MILIYLCQAIEHACYSSNINVNIRYIDSELFECDNSIFNPR